MDGNATAQRIIEFLRDIGIEVHEQPSIHASFLPGIRIVKGSLHVDRAQLTWPGDLLHEAGHLAVVPAHLRPSMDDALQHMPAIPHGGEIEAMAWAWAALRHLGLDAGILFHEGGYHGQSASLRMNFELGVYLGVGGLVASGLALAGPAVEQRLAYPHMQQWLRD